MLFAPKHRKQYQLGNVAISLLFICILVFIATLSNAQTPTKPNVILILGDDVGYEIPSVNGGKTYSTPSLDSIARNGMNFTHCEATPLCSPSRIQLLTGQYSFRNYSMWGWINNGQKTIGNIMQNAGYSTGWFGKSQFFSRDSDFHNMGWDDYLIFAATNWPGVGAVYKYKNPVLYGNGEIKMPDSLTHGKYGEDILTQRLLDFVDSNAAAHNPFFAYYPMALVHTPDQPTPDDTAYANFNPLSGIDDTIYFRSMVKYMDKKIGQIMQHLRDIGIDSNTIVIYCGDNGTPAGINSGFDDEIITGQKGNSVEAGTHVPLMIYWSGHITQQINGRLVDFTDILPTLAGISGTTDLSPYGVLDGKNILDTTQKREVVFCHFDPTPSLIGTAKRWVNDSTYKLYEGGGFYNIMTDRNEVNPIPDSLLTADETVIKTRFQYVLDTMPHPPTFPVLTNIHASNKTYSSAVLGATIVSDGGSPIIERGNMIAYLNPVAGYDFNRVSDSVGGVLTGGIGSFQITRRQLKPQTHYNYTLYAMNSNSSNRTGFIRDSFWTYSNPPIKQPTIIAVKSGTCYLRVNWSSASLPKASANKVGYLLIYSTGTPTISDTPNGKAPVIVANGRYVINQSTLPATPILYDTLFGLSFDSVYNFLLIPFTWDGVHPETYSYLTAGALTASAKPLASKLAITLTVQNPLCANTSTGSINAVATKGAPVYLFDVNGGSLSTTSFFNNLGAGTYLIAAKDAFGCSIAKSVILKQPAVLSLLITRTNISCKGGHDGSVKLAGRGGTAPYQYSFSGSTYDTVSTFSNLFAGTYTVAVKDNNGCIFSTTTRLTQSTTACSSLLAPEGSSSLAALPGLKVSVYPNPSQSQFRLMLTNAGSGKPVIIKVVDMYGKVLNQFTGTTKHDYRFGEDFPAGVYFVQVCQGASIKTVKIIKAR